MLGERTIQKVGQIILGSILLSIGVNGFIIPHHLLDGGLMGIALIFYYFFFHSNWLKYD